MNCKSLFLLVDITLDCLVCGHCGLAARNDVRRPHSSLRTTNSDVRHCEKRYVAERSIVTKQSRVFLLKKQNPGLPRYARNDELCVCRMLVAVC